MRCRRHALVLAAAAAAWSGSACRSGGAPSREGPILVLPFTVEPVSEAWMGEALAEETGRALAHAGASVAQLDGPTSAEYLLTAMMADGPVVTARVRLTRKADSSTVFEQALQFAPESLGMFPGQIATLVAEAFGRHTDPAARTAPTQAYRTYLRALAYRRSGETSDLRWAAELFRQVIAADSGYTPAWHGLREALRTIAIAEGRPSPGLETEWREAVRRSAALDSVTAAGQKPVVAGAESREH